MTRVAPGPSRLLAVVALATTLLASSPAALAQTVHEDYPRAERDEDAIRLAAQAVVDSCLVSTRDLLREDVDGAHEQANLSVLLSGRLQAAAEQPRGSVERPATLYVIAPLAVQLGQGMPETVRDVQSLRRDTIGRSEFLHVRGQAEATVAQMVENATALAAYGVQTADLVAALNELLAMTRRLDVPQADAPIEGAAGQGPDWTIQLASPSFGFTNRPAWFGQRVTASLAGAVASGEFHLTLFGTTYTAPIEGGYARIPLQVPWDIEVGGHGWRAEWGDGLTASGTLQVVRVPTSFLDVAHGRDGAALAVTARLQDANRAAVHPANVAWQAGMNGASVAAGTAETSREGRLAIAAPANATAVALSYAGNRTHAPALAELGVAIPSGAVESGLLVPPGATPDPSERRHGIAETLVDDAFPWWLLLTLLVAVALVVAAVRRIRRGRRLRSEALEEAGVMFLESSPPIVVVLPSDHPLLRVLANAGHDIGPLTMREAGSLWVRLGAPEVWDFVRRYEGTFYRGLAPPPVPGELLRWAQAKA